MSNRLKFETSPYLKQHAENPVDWFPWGAEALRKARLENKLILVSIGYSACHWCHVMEHECFEDREVAEIMNEKFVCIKIDREERPDIDQIYMTALQLMTGHGGWPLNCFCLPDQKPFYGGTYFPKEEWKRLLLNLAAIWEQKPGEAAAYAEKLTKGINELDHLDLSSEKSEYSEKDLLEIFLPWSKSFDWENGGYSRAPKFPVPNNWQFILRYAYLMQDQKAAEIAELTLDKMANGGIFDQIGGGFARYSVDEKWHVPHFEKMLYDNAQMVTLYSEAYQYFKKESYRETVDKTIGWLERELTSAEGAFYSALDADSEGVEGKFYVFTRSEIELVLGEDAALFCDLYNVTHEGNWPEERTNVLIKTTSEAAFASNRGFDLQNFRYLISSGRDKLFEYRAQRVKPGLDDKILASWNGLMLEALCKAYNAFQERRYLDLALRNAEFISARLLAENGSLTRIYKAGSQSNSIELAFLDDYAFVISGFIALYEATFQDKWLLKARTITEYVLQNFYDPGTGLLYYTSQRGEELIARKHEILDNVIPSSNSAMALNLYKLGHFFDFQPYIDQAKEMLAAVFSQMKTYGSGYSNWATLLTFEVFGLYEVAITGQHAERKRAELSSRFIPNGIVLGGDSSELPLLAEKPKEDKIYVCVNKVCALPSTEVADALSLIPSARVSHTS